MSAKPAMTGAGGPEMFECAMCLDDLVAEKGNSITCGCGTTVCTECVKDFLLHTTKEVHCMKCKRAWDRATQYDYLGPKFVNGPYRKHHKTFLLNKEKLRLPETMAVIAAEKEAKVMEETAWDVLRTLETNYKGKKTEINISNCAELLTTVAGKQYDSAWTVFYKDRTLFTKTESQFLDTKRAFYKIVTDTGQTRLIINQKWSVERKTIKKHYEPLIRQARDKWVRLPETMALITNTKETKMMEEALNVLNVLRTLETNYEGKKNEITTSNRAELLATADGKQYISAKAVFDKESTIFEKTKSQFLDTKRAFNKIVTDTNPVRLIIDQKWSVERETIKKHYAPLIRQALNKWCLLRNKKSTTKKVVFARRCPDEECRGFLSPNNKCGLCDQFSCDKCMKIIGNKPAADDDTHECNPDDMASVQMLKKETRPCPKCVTPIYKISGCDQMWCTQCHVTFSWISGQIVTSGPLHNPHYYTFLREHGAGAIRTPEEVVCGGIPTARRIIARFNDVVDFITQKLGPREEILTLIPQLVDAHRFAGHLTAIILPPLRRTARTESNNEELRKDFMKGKIDEARLISNLSRRDNVRTKNIEILRVLEITNTVMVENFNTFMTHKGNDSAVVWIEHLNALNTSIQAIRNYTNTQMMKISTLFKMKTPLITDAWEDISVLMTPDLEKLGTATAIYNAHPKRFFARYRCRR